MKSLDQKLNVSKCLVHTIINQCIWALKQTFYWTSTQNTFKHPNFAVCFEISLHVAQVNLASWSYYVIEGDIELWTLLLSISKYTTHHVTYEALGRNFKAWYLLSNWAVSPAHTLTSQFFSWLLWQMKCGHQETSTECLAWSSHTVAKSMEVKANWEEAIWKGRCNMHTLLPVSFPLLHPCLCYFRSP